MPRLFTGLEIPGSVAALLAELRGGLSAVRWVEPENYHVTLRFIGDIDNPAANDVAEALGAVRRPAFLTRIEGLGAFGGRKPHAVYAALQPAPELVALQADNERAVQRAGLPPEGRKFMPHVTLGRVKGAPASAVATYLEARGGVVTAPFEVARFVLFSARPGQGGGPYVVEEAYPLDGAKGAT